MTVPAKVRERAVSEMLAVDTAMNAVPRHWLEMLAAELRVHPATLYRWLHAAREAADADRGVMEHPKVLSDDQIAVVYENFGNLAAAKRSWMRTSLSSRRCRMRRSVAAGCRWIRLSGRERLTGRRVCCPLSCVSCMRLTNATSCGGWIIRSCPCGCFRQAPPNLRSRG